MSRVFGVAAVAAALAFVAPVKAEDVVLTVSVRGHRFEPIELKAPANKPFTLHVKNLDKTPIEFESKALRVEKVIAGSAHGSVKVRALKPGRYGFFDEYNEATAKGVVVVE